MTLMRRRASVAEGALLGRGARPPGCPNSGGMLTLPKKESTPDAVTQRLNHSERIWNNSRERRRFLLSMLHWCGIGGRSTPPDYWKLLLVRARGDVVGVSGLYRQPGMPHKVCWIGWFGIRPRLRREGFGTSTMHALIDVARNIGYQVLWVYTGSSNDAAVCFYKSLGFEVLASAADWAPGQTMEDSDIVLRRML
jgi:ribosomal protein S18 acetylase RimI-like enzyme